MELNKTLLEKFKKVMRMSNRISQTQAAEMMGIDPSLLTQKLFEWGDLLPFKIESNEIVIQDPTNFVEQIDTLFEAWETGTNQKSKINVNLNSIDEQIHDRKETKMEKRMKNVEKNRKLIEKNEDIPELSEKNEDIPDWQIRMWQRV
ncbi:hypothetical protein [Candidatus Lokiarchaeum ossiferum]|uniref:hypothetical protein n=1 Tax=Candidatus Lokiarchaeum ossiferum TaxID=2951803 RepID=UPI00352BE805